MLNFLNNRIDQQTPSITGIPKKPAIVFGVSPDSPSEFVNKHTTISHASDINPHLKYDELRLSKVTFSHKKRIENNQWKNKTNLNLIEEQKVFKRDIKDENRLSNYHLNHQKQLNKNSTRFRLVKGEFSDFINKQHKNEILGPLEGQQRTLERARKTKINLRQQSISSLQKLRSNPSLLSTYRPSNTWRQKGNIRKSRDLLYNSFKVQQQTRRFNRSPQFQLPKVIRQDGQNSSKKSKYFNFKTIDSNSSTLNLYNPKSRYQL